MDFELGLGNLPIWSVSAEVRVQKFTIFRSLKNKHNRINPRLKSDIHEYQ
jgi:hypothetical protein